MKLKPIGTNCVEAVPGVLLTPEEYEKHPAFHPFCFFNRPTLFVTFNKGDSWTDVPVSHASRYALLEATDPERTALWLAGYRMLNLAAPGSPRCRCCLRAMPFDAPFSGPTMWHVCRHTCGHREYILCPGCWAIAPNCCSVCDNQELYC